MRPMLDSLLMQTYKNVEFFFVNDGSTDHTEDIFLEYKPKLEQKGWKVIYHKQPNGGAAKAVNFGLGRFSGKYLTWPDSDDILYSNCLQRRVEYMEMHPECDLLLTSVDTCNQDNLDYKLQPMRFIMPHKNETFFTKFLYQQGVLFCPISSFARANSVKQVIPSLHIYDESKGGQNWQMLLPLSYKKNVQYLDVILACYVNRESSHSHTTETDAITRQTQYEEVLTHAILSLSTMPQKEKQHYLRQVKIKYAVKRARIRIRAILQCVLGEQYFNRLKEILKK